MVKYYFRLLLAFLLFFPMGEALAQWEKGSYPNLDALTRRDAILKLRDSLEQAKPNDPRNKVLGAVHVPKAWLDNYQSLCKSLNKNSRVLYRTWDGRYALVASFYTHTQIGDKKAPEGKYPLTIDRACDIPQKDPVYSESFFTLDTLTAYTLTAYPIHLSDNLWRDMKGNKAASNYKPFSESSFIDTSIAAFYSIDLAHKHTSKLLYYAHVGIMKLQALEVNKSHLCPLADVPEEDAGDGYTCAVDSLAPSTGGATVDYLQTLLLRLDGAVPAKEFIHESRGPSNLLVHKDRSIYTLIKEDIQLADSNSYAQPICYDITGKQLGEGSLIHNSTWPITHGWPIEIIPPEAYFFKIPAQLKVASREEIETAVLGLGKPISEYSTPFGLFSEKDSTARVPSDSELYHTKNYRSEESWGPDLTDDQSILVRVNVAGYYKGKLVTEEGDLLTLVPYGYTKENWDSSKYPSEEYKGQFLLRVDPNYVTELRKKDQIAGEYSNDSRLDQTPYFPDRSYFFTSADVARSKKRKLREQPKPRGSHYIIEGAIVIYEAGQKTPI